MSTPILVKKAEIPRFPIILLGATIVFTILTLFWLGWSNYNTEKVLSYAVIKEFHALELRGAILENDEMLTRYAELGVATGDKQWEQQYEALVPIMTNLINEAIQYTPEENNKESVNKADIANQQLVLMEREVFVLIRQGKLADAKKIISSVGYETQQKLFREGMEKYVTTIHSRAKDYLAELHKDVRYSMGIVAIDFILLIVFWTITLRHVIKWGRELEKIIIVEMQYKREIENARHFLHEMTVINKMNDKLQTCQQLSDAYSVIKHTAAELFPDLSGGLSMRQKSSNELEVVQAWGDAQYLKSIFAMNDCWALREGHAYIVNNTKKGLNCQHFTSSSFNSYLCLPLIVQDGVMGLLELNADESGSITDYQQQLAMTFSEVLRLSIGNIQLRESLNEQAAHDSLTGLFNRRYLNETLPRELKRIIRTNNSLCVAMLDIDFFKRINDSYGHEAGDEVLRFIANQLKVNLRASDIACRFGGEEFLLVLNDSKMQDALPHLQQICKEVKEAKITYSGLTLPSITVSIGVAEAPANAANAADIIRMADEALYKAKHDGRDRIEVFAAIY